MSKTIIKKINNVLNKSQKKIDEHGLIGLIRRMILRKYGIDANDYIRFLDKHGIIIDKKGVEDNEIHFEYNEDHWRELDSYEICSIFDEYLSNDKREFEGSYYTPTYIIEYMINNSLRLYLIESTNIEPSLIEEIIKNEEINKLNIKQTEKILDLLNSIRIIDISCGTGLFLLKTINKLISLKEAILIKLGKNIDKYNMTKITIENNVFGIDLDNKPLEILLLAIVDNLGRYKEFELKALSTNIYNENSIKEYKICNIKKIRQIMDRGGFDIVIGNPPYIGEKGNKEKFEEIKKYEFGKRYYEGKMDYFYFFIYRGIELMNNRGILTYITTNYFITADGASKLRKFLKNMVNFRTIINFNECQIFKSAKGQHNLIFSISKDIKGKSDMEIAYFNKAISSDIKIKSILYNLKEKHSEMSYYILDNQHELYSSTGNIMLYSHSNYSTIINKIKNNSDCFLGEICNINQGIVSGADRVTKNMLSKKLNKDEIEKNNIVLNKGIFVLSKEEVNSNDFSNCYNLKPFYKNSNIKKYYTGTETNKFIFYVNDRSITCGKYCKLVSNHLIKYKSMLSKRRETAKGVRKWYSLQWGRNPQIFEKPKIVVPQRAVKNNFGYNELPWYASADVYYITLKEDKYNLKFLLGILNSKLIYFWLYNLGKRKGNYLELYSRPLSEIPIKININEDVINYIVNLTDIILDNCQEGYNEEIVRDYQNEIDNKLYELYDFNKNEIEIINSLYKTIYSNR